MERNIRYVLFEDEYYTSASIKSIIARFRPNYRLVGESETVATATAILSADVADLVIASMQLADGCCIDAFHLSHCSKPTILMAERKIGETATGLNVVDCLLKPVSSESIQKAIERFENNI